MSEHVDNLASRPSIRWLSAAEVIDAYRVWPRGLIVLYGYMVYQVTTWFMGLPDPNGPQSALISTIWGASAAWFGVYVHSGRKWNNEVVVYGQAASRNAPEMPPRPHIDPDRRW